MNAEVHFISKPAFSSIMEFNPHIDRHWVYSDEQALQAELKSEHFDLVVDLQKNIQSKRLIKALGVESITFDKTNVRKWLYVNFKFPALPNTHIVDRYFEALASLGLKNDGLGLDFHIDPKVEADEGDQDYICVALGAAHMTKQIPVSIIMQICDRIKMKVCLLGGNQDVEKGEEIANGREHVTNYAGSYSLHQSARKLEGAKMLLTGDTGLMHMAVGLSIPTLVMWGNTVPELGMSPYYGDKDVFTYNHEVNGLSCRPCSKLGKKQCPKGHFKCMKNQNIDLIVEQIQSFIEV